MEVTKKMLSLFEERFDRDGKNAVAMNAVTSNGIKKAALNYQAARDMRNEFSISLEQTGVTNQKQSGRCWMFAALNVLRFGVVKKYNLESFEFSQNYTLFYDKLEKANYFLENVIETYEEPADSRLLQHLIGAATQDGGQWDMICNIITKYGVVPKDAMPETACSSATAEMDFLLLTKLQEDAMLLRRAMRSGADRAAISAQKDEMLADIYKILAISLGKPPKTFDFEARDKDKKFIRFRDMTPERFYREFVGVDVNDYVSVINAPTEDKPYYRSFTVRYLGNVREGRIVRYLNLPSDEVKALAIAQLKDGSPVWFGCDVGKEFDRDAGILDTENYKTDELFGIRRGMTKGERILYGNSLMTHAMVFVGVNLDESGLPNRWRVENSWGKERFKEGFMVMSDRWFDEYNYQVVVHKKYLSAEQRAAYESKPVELDPWDPMGSLA